MGAEAFNPCALVPVYNHPAKLAETITALRADGLPVVLVDDGSDHECRQLMAALAATTAGIHLIRRPCNGGKGAAVKDGLWAARHHGYSHAIQIDADGQHDISDAVRFLEVAAQRPGALVAGYPAYDASVPRHRYYSRYLSHLWVWINTLSVTIRDSMCGFRVYPVGASCALLDAETMGDRMDFDGEFIVHWVWAGHPLEQLQTRVIYPEDGVSHFRLWRDNGLIALMHARLFFGMLRRLPRLLARKFTNPATPVSSGHGS